MSYNSSIVKLNVGGTYFQSTVLTLVLRSGYFRTMFDPTHHPVPSGEIFIDRSPHIFKHVISFIRDVDYPYPRKYIKELDFYQVEYEDFPDPMVAIINRMNKMEKHLYVITRELASTNPLQIRHSPYSSPQPSPSQAPPMPNYGRNNVNLTNNPNILNKHSDKDNLTIDTGVNKVEPITDVKH